jgi:hypothetical protein
MISASKLETEPDLFQNPVHLCKALWPHTYFYDRECDMIMGVREAASLFVVAGNELGKDFTLGRICWSFWVAPWVYFPESHFRAAEQRPDMVALARTRGIRTMDLPEHLLHQRRVVTTSVKQDHLDVLWGEIGTAFRTCSMYGQLREKFVLNDKEVRFREEVNADGGNAYSYMIGKVSGSENMEGLTGHHAHYNLAAGDECSGLDDRVKEAFEKWAKREVYIGNSKPCSNFFKNQFREGDLLIPEYQASAA